MTEARSITTSSPKSSTGSRATEWSGIPDKIEVKIIVYDGGTGKEVGSTLISGRSKWATFGGDHPQDLLPEPLNSYVESLYYDVLVSYEIKDGW